MQAVCPLQTPCGARIVIQQRARLSGPVFGERERERERPLRRSHKFTRVHRWHLRAKTTMMMMMAQPRRHTNVAVPFWRIASSLIHKSTFTVFASLAPCKTRQFHDRRSVLKTYRHTNTNHVNIYISVSSPSEPKTRPIGRKSAITFGAVLIGRLLRGGAALHEAQCPNNQQPHIVSAQHNNNKPSFSRTTHATRDTRHLRISTSTKLLRVFHMYTCTLSGSRALCSLQ